MKAIQENIYWVGYVDWELRSFHGYSTPSGSTYNAYLILDEQPTLIDTVKHYGAEEMLRHIRAIIDPLEIKYIISNHTEMDHSGTIDRLLEFCPQARIVCSPKGEEGLRRHFKKNWNFKVVQTGDQLKIGKRTLSFLLMPMVHWPDSMATYSSQDKILFPNDAFGQHCASSQRFADEIGVDIVYKEAAKYYANIVLPYGQQVLKVLEVLPQFEIEMICPSHGLIWRRREDIQKIVQLYQKWAEHLTEDRVVIVYDTMWHSTERMAQQLYCFIEKEGIPVKLVNLQKTDISDIVTDILEAKFFLAGSPILNNRILPNMAKLLMYLKGLKPKNRLAATFGSYGWSTIGFKEFEESLQEAGFELLSAGKYLRYIPDQTELDELSGLASLIKAKCVTPVI